MSTPSPDQQDHSDHSPRWGRAQHGAPLVIGHRGASRVALENTLEAFERARADGADGVELDVLRCATGEVVVFHDDDLVRLARRPERIDAMSFAQVREVRFAGGERIPTLDEVLECLSGMLVNIELKAPIGTEGLALARVVARRIARHRDVERLLISSFNPLALGVFRAFAPHVATGMLFHRDQARASRRAWARHGLRPTALHPEDVLATPHDVRAWHGEGYAVNVWTVNDPGELRRLRDMGVDGLITDDPAAARTALATG